MTTFTIDNDNNITAFAKAPAGIAADQQFTTEKELAKLAVDWPASRLLDTWNSFAGVAPFDDLKPVKKFKHRKDAFARIWKAVQRLVAAPAPQAAQDAPKRKGSTRNATAAKKTARAQKGGQEARDGSKKAEVLDLMRRPKGATLAAIMKATGWQAHTVRGFVSGTLTKKLGLKVDSFRGDDKERTYRIAG